MKLNVIIWRDGYGGGAGY
ncbi:hypothetical protein CGLO_18171 [Colletotrichum gloeosporioides Cg-14]|uniref:Uncharacterized protein n=1 Tax=Colletotrichum gloeosporioides (strain Cg-14) TaxID=1237896 RepID=T0L4N3_COLGC|nr:hypothetical protein CGLO_18171 [Colletotrichum gloeosporioides Cg-14]